MYKYFNLITLTQNVNGGCESTIEKMTKEVDGKVVPCNLSESILKMREKVSKVGGNNATYSIKCILLNPNGSVNSTDEITKNDKPTEEV